MFTRVQNFKIHPRHIFQFKRLLVSRRGHTPRELEKYQKLFRFIDENGNGRIDQEELFDYLRAFDQKHERNMRDLWKRRYEACYELTFEEFVECWKEIENSDFPVEDAERT